MRIIQLINWHRFGGGSDNIARTTAQLLSERGHEVRMLAHDSHDYASSLRGKLGAFVHGIYSAPGMREMQEAIAAFHPDVVHIHEVYPHHSPWVFASCKRAGVPVVMTCHDYRLTCPNATHLSHGEACTRCATQGAHWCAIKNCRGSRSESIAYAARGITAHVFGLFRSNVSMFIAPSEMVRRHMIEIGGYDPNRFVVVPNVVDSVDEPADPAYGEYVAYAGRIAPEKGVDTLIEAAHIAGLPLHIAGAASSRTTDSEIVTWRGLLDSPALRAFYRGARFVVTPSRWNEAFGLVPAEAMTHGIPVIASRMGALPELIEHGVTGLLFEAGNAPELASRMTKLWNDPARCRTMGLAARTRILEMCSPSRYCERLIRVYEHASAYTPFRGPVSAIPSNELEITQQ
ncbi:MAG: glycosyltransferase family 4 protein [Candidatus Hydrogenedentes bacterium]|nr:glycosyltransferase family 4 protein [Candidatus Hydrogenedentota bacterium]